MVEGRALWRVEVLVARGRGGAVARQPLRIPPDEPARVLRIVDDFLDALEPVVSFDDVAIHLRACRGWQEVPDRASNAVRRASSGGLAAVGQSEEDNEAFAHPALHLRPRRLKLLDLRDHVALAHRTCGAGGTRKVACPQTAAVLSVCHPTPTKLGW